MVTWFISSSLWLGTPLSSGQWSPRGSLWRTFWKSFCFLGKSAMAGAQSFYPTLSWVTWGDAVWSCYYIVTVWTWQRDLTKILTQSLDVVEDLSKLWNHPPSDLCCAKWLNVVIPNSLRAGIDSEGRQAEPEWDGVSGKTSKRRWLTLAHQLFRENGAHIYFGKMTDDDTLWTHFLESLLNWLN